MLLFSYLGMNQVHCIKNLGILSLSGNQWATAEENFEQRSLKSLVGDGATEVGVPGLPASLLSPRI